MNLMEMFIIALVIMFFLAIIGMVASIIQASKRTINLSEKDKEQLKKDAVEGVKTILRHPGLFN